ncbi:hypothetical protein BCR44DRAFT_1458389 [Catenaria anguillulae PL171]|uniref:MYND-type domain-containing protein n=1 Tax=Catenaria anguillulae PL171 TaxID=765915 RepID=A0A1Y2I2I6_9FUNG|nr:hypothetical protein BCR44DRAFT_1458389 [Catenaria anguillulae PL171]
MNFNFAGMPSQGGLPAGFPANIFGNLNDFEDGAREPVEYETRTHEHHKMFWYPNRCEYPDCNAPARSLRTCSGCRMVRYCSPEHQKADWNAHKLDCKCFRRLGVTAKFYSDEEMLAKYPLRTRKELKNHVKTAELHSSCDVCNVKDTEVDMILTECCGATVCDTEGDYVMMTYSRDHCPRSHRRYTHCGYHGVESWCDKSVDWRLCPGCKQHKNDPSEVADYLWRGNNGYNVTPLLTADVPRHSMCDTCGLCELEWLSMSLVLYVAC